MTTFSEETWSAFRSVRDRYLAETDVWVLPDRTVTSEQLAYRQALRDLPANTADPTNPVWPTRPGSEPVAEEPVAEEPVAE